MVICIWYFAVVRLGTNGGGRPVGAFEPLADETRVSTRFKSIEFCQNGHTVLKKYGNSKFSHLLQILFFTADTVLQK